MKFELSNLQEKAKAFSTSVADFFLQKNPPANVPSKVTACDFGRSRVLAVEIEKKNDHIFIHRLEVVKHSAHDSKPIGTLKRLFEGKKIQKNDIRVALKGHGVVIRFIRFPKMKIEELGSVMKYEAEQYIPFELKDVALDFAVVDEGVKTDEGEKMEVMLAVIKRQDLDPMLEMFHTLESNLSVVDVDILAGMAALEYFHPADFSGHVGLLDLGTEISTLGIIRQEKPRFIRDISYGTLDLQKRLKTRANLTEENVDQLLEKKETPSSEALQVIKESLAGLVGDLRVSIDYYLDQSADAKPIEKLFISGISHPVILETLSSGLQIPVECCVDSMEKIKAGPDIDPQLLQAHLSLLPVAIGLGIRQE